MVSSCCIGFTNSISPLSSTFTISSKITNSQKNPSIAAVAQKPNSVLGSKWTSTSSSSSDFRGLLTVVPLAASMAVLFWTNPVNAGILSGFSGLESVPGPELPQIDFLNRFNEENQKKYAANDERFKSSDVLKEYLEKSKLNKEKNKQGIQDKYCLRGAEWGVGDCSTAGMTDDEKDKFIAMLREKTGITD
ncbi:uncharacterized protein LOC113275868 [Papaver somniferum]|uniref:uncharacterized protein LOC113275868 n=1 Tax=Papaver somniferum TaxID=3469 RepID=UPI000E701453|nr:uncharacterized protein LOC113275868 [Papaver somniferum]